MISEGTKLLTLSFFETCGLNANGSSHQTMDCIWDHFWSDLKSREATHVLHACLNSSKVLADDDGLMGRGTFP